MSLFQNSVLNKYLKGLESEKVSQAYELFTSHFHNPKIQQNIRNSKEEQYQEGFVNDLFVKILGYVKNPAPNYNFITEQKNQGDSKKADGAIIIDEKVRAVVELKGCNTTDLGKVEAQAFGYKNRQPGCDYVLVSNFEKIRLYVENAVEHLEFNLFELSKADFALLWLCLSHDSISADLPLKLKSESLSAENEITKELYHDYSVFRRALFNDLVQKNLETDKLLLFKKTQKLLDRFLFIFFAEDRLLLPVNLIKNIISEWEKLREMRVEHSLYERFKLYFNDLDTGNPKQDIFAYNGGLFQPDEILDKLQVDDQLLFEHTHKLSTYDFESEVDVNILGHIFENSLNEIEEIENQVAQNQEEGAPLQLAKTSKRKKDGVFYTPKYITKYIVENTLGKLCAEKKNELEIADEIYVNAKKRNRKRLENLQKYRDWLLQLSICDPACGSGAFLNQALEFLIEEHRYLDELSAKYNNEPLVLSDIENSILENNLYGVDINEESVHIAKLSLWLRTAQRNRKLNDLNQNLKCGNSLIADPEIAGKKAFDWEKEFPQVFDPSTGSGGFDVVIGNPPYVDIRRIDQEQKKYFNENYNQYNSFDLYTLFLEKSKVLINEKGLISLIIPKPFLYNSTFEKIRAQIFKNELLEIVFFDYDVFESASVESIIITYSNQEARKKFRYNFNLKNVNQLPILEEYLMGKPIILDSENVIELLRKLDESPKISSYVEITRGLELGKKTLPRQEKHFENSVKLFAGEAISKYSYNNSLAYFVDKNDIESYKKNLQEDFLKYPRLLMRRVDSTPICTLLEEGENFINNLNSVYNLAISKESISAKFLITVLNSRLSKFYINKKYNSVEKIFPYIRIEQIKELPFVEISLSDQQPFLEKADQMLSLNKELNAVLGKFSSYFSGQYGLQKLSRKLENWHELEFSDFTKELNKAIKKEKREPLTKKEAFEWLELFEDNKAKAQNLQSQIEATDREIDQMVYELYDLTEEEIAIVEEATH